MRRRWILPSKPDGSIVNRLISELGIPSLVASLLSVRGIHDPEEASLFLDPRLASLYPPEEIPGIAQATVRLLQAVANRERITLYGDYDVDGVSSLAILGRYLRSAGAVVSFFVPERAAEGYGLSAAGISRCLAESSPSLLVAVDCGTNSLREAELLARSRCSLIVLDHHEPDEANTASPCDALVNPKLGERFHHLCSAGVVFKLCHALQKASPVEGVDLRNYLDLVALGTVADIVPLVGENRIFVKAGLKRLEHSCWPGLQALLHVSGATAPHDPSDIGFKLGPRINAAGRLASASEALTLLLTDDIAVASRIASGLDLQNRERQSLERDVTRQAEEWVESHFDPSRHATIVAGRRDWHQGVVGIVASRVSRRWHRPTLIIGFDGEGAGKGSGRSIEGLPLVEALSRCSDLLDAFGGHDMAAGLSLHEDRLGDLRERFESAAREHLSEEDLVPRLSLDAELDLGLADDAWLETQEGLAPFGTANAQPLLFSRGVTPVTTPKVLKEKHLRLDLKAAGARRQAIWFNGALEELPRPPWDVAYMVDRNTWQGRDEAQIRIVAVRSSDSA